MAARARRKACHERPGISNSLAIELSRRAVMFVTFIGAPDREVRTKSSGPVNLLRPLIRRSMESSVSGICIFLLRVSFTLVNSLRYHCRVTAIEKGGMGSEFEFDQAPVRWTHSH